MKKFEFTKEEQNILKVALVLEEGNLVYNIADLGFSKLNKTLIRERFEELAKNEGGIIQGYYDNYKRGICLIQQLLVKLDNNLIELDSYEIDIIQRGLCEIYEEYDNQGKDLEIITKLRLNVN